MSQDSKNLEIEFCIHNNFAFCLDPFCQQFVFKIVREKQDDDFFLKQQSIVNPEPELNK